MTEALVSPEARISLTSGRCVKAWRIFFLVRPGRQDVDVADILLHPPERPGPFDLVRPDLLPQGFNDPFGDGKCNPKMHATLALSQKLNTALKVFGLFFPHPREVDREPFSKAFSN